MNDHDLKLLVERGKTSQEKAGRLLAEASELVAITVSSLNTARRSVTPSNGSAPNDSALRAPRSAFDS